MSVATILDSFKEAVHELYTKNSEKIIKLVEIYGDSLKKNGNVRYCGTSDYGVLALIDSSECPVRVIKLDFIILYKSRRLGQILMTFEDLY